MRRLLLLLFIIPLAAIAQEPIFKQGIPDDLDKERIIFLEHEPVKVTVRKK